MRGYNILLGILLLAVAFFYAPEASTDLNSLILEESLTVGYQNGKITIRGETLSGQGAGWNTAMEQVYATATGTVFLETTDRILIHRDAVECLPEILQDERLRPGTQLYIFQGEQGEALTEFAEAHESNATIAECADIPILMETTGGNYFVWTE